MNKALFAAAVSSIALVSTAAHADTTKFDASVGLAIGVNASSRWADPTRLARPLI